MLRDELPEPEYMTDGELMDIERALAEELQLASMEEQDIADDVRGYIHQVVTTSDRAYALTAIDVIDAMLVAAQNGGAR